MVCKEFTSLLCDYIEGELDPETHEELEEHFKDCPPCVAFLNTYKKTSQLCRQTLGQIEIPPALKKKLNDFIKNKFKKSSEVPQR